jgi:hypothetical protein
MITGSYDYRFYCFWFYYQWSYYVMRLLQSDNNAFRTG